MKHLFIEGPIQTGKSTLIIETLMPYTASAPSFNTIGGFTCQRLISSGKTVAFRIGPAMATPLTAPAGDIAVGSDGVFKAFADGGKKCGGKEMTNAVFETDGISYIREISGKSLMLLDEIGGQELESRPFMEALYDLLSGDIPCIGVIKRYEDAKRLGKRIGDLNMALRTKILEDFDGEILYYERGDETVRKKIEDFLSTKA